MRGKTGASPGLLILDAIVQVREHVEAGCKQFHLQVQVQVQVQVSRGPTLVGMTLSSPFLVLPGLPTTPKMSPRRSLAVSARYSSSEVYAAIFAITW